MTLGVCVSLGPAHPLPASRRLSWNVVDLKLVVKCYQWYLKYMIFKNIYVHQLD